jgi:hypothetical protein
MYTPVQAFVYLSCVFNHFVSTNDVSTLKLMPHFIRVNSIFDKIIKMNRAVCR